MVPCLFARIKDVCEAECHGGTSPKHALAGCLWLPYVCSPTCVTLYMSNNGERERERERERGREGRGGRRGSKYVSVHCLCMYYICSCFTTSCNGGFS